MIVYNNGDIMSEPTKLDKHYIESIRDISVGLMAQLEATKKALEFPDEELGAPDPSETLKLHQDREILRKLLIVVDQDIETSLSKQLAYEAIVKRLGVFEGHYGITKSALGKIVVREPQNIELTPSLPTDPLRLIAYLGLQALPAITGLLQSTGYAQLDSTTKNPFAVAVATSLHKVSAEQMKALGTALHVSNQNASKDITKDAEEKGRGLRGSSNEEDDQLEVNENEELIFSERDLAKKKKPNPKQSTYSLVPISAADSVDNWNGNVDDLILKMTFPETTNENKPLLFRVGNSKYGFTVKVTKTEIEIINVSKAFPKIIAPRDRYNNGKPQIYCSCGPYIGTATHNSQMIKPPADSTALVMNVDSGNMLVKGTRPYIEFWLDEPSGDLNFRIKAQGYSPKEINGVTVDEPMLGFSTYACTADISDAAREELKGALRTVKLMNYPGSKEELGVIEPHYVPVVSTPSPSA